MAFKAIETQEELDNIIGERLKREREQAERKYAGYDEAKEKASKYDELAARNLDAKVKELSDKLAEAAKAAEAKQKEVETLTARAAAAEAAGLKAKVAHEAGLPYELAARLSGTTEEELKKDAEILAGFVRPRSAPPLSTGDKRATGNDKDAAYVALASALANQN